MKGLGRNAEPATAFSTSRRPVAQTTATPARSARMRRASSTPSNVAGGVDIGEQDIGTAAGREIRERIAAVAEGVDRKARLGERDLDHQADQRLVLDQKHVRR